MEKIFRFLLSIHLIEGLLRYFLGPTMILYGLTKILRTQFVILPFSIWQVPLEHLAGSHLASAFLGYADWFTVLLGFLELIPAILLLFRKTAFLGSVWLLPLLLSIVSVNYALDLSENTQMISVMLLMANLLILFFKRRELVHIAKLLFNTHIRFKMWKPELWLNLAVIVFVGYSSTKPLFSYLNEKNMLTGDWHNRHSYEWQAQNYQVLDSLKVSELFPNIFVEKDQYYFMPFGRFEGIALNKNFRGLKYELHDTTPISLRIIYQGSIRYSGNLNIINDSIIELSRITENNKLIDKIELKKRMMNPRRYGR